MTTISKEGIALIKKYEGCKLTAYLCAANVWTIGYGHTGADVYEGEVISEQVAEMLLISDLMRFSKGIRELVKSVINQNQFDALVSLAFNIGLGAFKRSNVLKKVNENPNNLAIADEILGWNTAGGKVLLGLTNRRKEEVNLYFNEQICNV